MIWIAFLVLAYSWLCFFTIGAYFWPKFRNWVGKQIESLRPPPQVIYIHGPMEDTSWEAQQKRKLEEAVMQALRRYQLECDLIKKANLRQDEENCALLEVERNYLGRLKKALE